MPDSPEAIAARDAYSLEIEQELSTVYLAGKAKVRALIRLFDPELQQAGYLVLRHVLANEPVRGGDIAATLAMDKSAVSRQLTVLREADLIEARPDPLDGRASLIVSSEKARAALRVFRAEIKASYARTLATWNSDDIESFARLLAKFNASR